MSTPDAAASKRLVADARFKHVHTDPRFQRQAKTERKFQPDARFQKMFTDSSFNTQYKVDAWGRKIETGTGSTAHELARYYEMDEETKEKMLNQGKGKKGKKAEGKEEKSKTKTTKKPTAEEEVEDEEASSPAPAAASTKSSKSAKSTKPSKSTPVAVAAASSSSSKSSKASKPSSKKSRAPVVDPDDSEDDGGEFDGALGDDDDAHNYDEDDELGDLDEKGFSGSFMSSRGMAPPSSGEEEDEDEDEDGDEAAAAVDDEDEKEVDVDENEEAEAEEEKDSSDDDDEDSDIEMEVALEEEEILTGEITTRRLAVQNLEWDRLSSVDLLVLFRSFVPQPPGSLRHPVKRVTVYPSQFGQERMRDEAQYGPTSIYGQSQEEYKKRLEEKMKKVEAPMLEDEEEDGTNAKPEEEDESERSESEEEEEEEEEEDQKKNKKKRVSFPTGTKNSKKTKSATATPAKPTKKEVDEDDDLAQAEDDILSRPSASSNGAGEDSDSDSSSSKDDRRDADGSTEFDREKLRIYELERLKYYYAIVECDTPETAQLLYQGCDGLEFEHSSNTIDLRYVPDDVDFSEEEKLIRDICAKVPTNYKSPEFYTQALQHTNVQLTWDRDDPIRTKLLSKKYNPDDEAAEDLKAYLGSDNEEDGYGSDAVTEASDSGSDDGENEEQEGEKKNVAAANGGSDSDEGDADKPLKKSKKVVLKRKARAKYKALLEEIKKGSDNEDGDDGEDNHEVSITFEPGLRAKGEEIARKALKKQSEGEQQEESTWEKHLRERLEKKKAKKKARKEKLKGGDGEENGKSAGGDEDEDSGDEIGGPSAKIESDLFDDDEVPYDEDDDFFKLSDEEELEELKPNQRMSKGKKAQEEEEDDSDDSDVDMSSESDEDNFDHGNGDAMSDDDEDEDDIDTYHGKEKAKRMFDDSAPTKSKGKNNKKGLTPVAAAAADMQAERSAKANASSSAAGKKKDSKKRKRSNDDDGENGDASVDTEDAKQKAHLELLMMDTNGTDVKGYDLKSLLKQKKLSNQAEAGGKRSKKMKREAEALKAEGRNDEFNVDTSDSRFGALYNNSAFSIDPTHPSYLETEGTEQLLKEKAKRRMEQEKENAQEIRKRKEEAKKNGSGGVASAENDSTPVPAASSSASLASLVASVKRKTTQAVNQTKKPAVAPVGKSSTPASKRSKPDSGKH